MSEKDLAAKLKLPKQSGDAEFVFDQFSLFCIYNFQILHVYVFVVFAVNSADAETDLLQATHQDNFDAVRDFVLAKVDLSQCDQQGNNVVHYAARSGNVQLLEVNKLFRPPALLLPSPAAL